MRRLAPFGLWLALVALALPAGGDEGEALPGVGAFSSPTAAPLARIGVAVAVVSAAAWGCTLWVRRRQIAHGGRDAQIEVIARRGLGPRHQLVLVEIGGQRLLIGMAGDTLATLAELGGPAQPGGFGAALETAMPARDALGRGELLDSIGRFEGLDA